MSAGFQQHVALFGGSFDPPHVGHVQAARGLYQYPGVKKVIALPAFGNPLKGSGSSFDHRFTMAKLAFPSEIEVSNFENEQKIEYTSLLLEKISPRYPKLAFVIGTDQLAKIELWKKFPDVMVQTDWIVLIRRPQTLNDQADAIRKLSTHGFLRSTADPREYEIRLDGKSSRLRFAETEAMQVSSTEIREKLALGKTAEVRSLLPAPVLDYIERNKLYGT